MGQDQGKHFIATEFIDGVTLGQKVSAGPLKLNEALDIACQVALALTAAHEAKIIHRDIKPENIMLRRDHIVKVLDFGLAKLTETMPVAHDAEAPTKALVKTAPGRFMGTVKYSSPEQVQAIELDARTDIWSLGVVLYEMVTGSEPFSGNTANHVCVAILEKEPAPLASLAPGAPPELQRIVRKSLAKDRDDRYQTARDLLIDLKSLKQDLEFAARVQHSAPPELSSDETGSAEVTLEGAPKAGRQTNEAKAASTTLNTAYPKRKALLWTAAALGGFVIILVAALRIWSIIKPPPPPKVGTTVQLTNDGRTKTSHVTDGSRVYFSEDLLLGFAQVSTTGGEPTTIQAHFLEGPGQGLLDISRDRNELLISNAEAGGLPSLWVMSVLGGPGRRVGDLRAFTACWSPDNQRIAYTNPEGLYIAKSDGTESRKLVTPPVGGFPIFPAWSLDGSRLRFNMLDWSKDTFTNDTPTLWEEAVDGTGLHPLLPGWKGKDGNNGWGGRWTPDGRYYVFLVGGDVGKERGADIWALRETESFFGKTARTPIQLTFGPLSFSPPVFSPDGKKLFTVGYLPRAEVMSYDVPTKHWGPVLSGTSAINLGFSRDGQWVTYVTYLKGPLWRSRADGSQRLQLTSPEMTVTFPRWSPDGKQIAFAGKVSGQPFQIFVVSARRQGGTGGPAGRQ
jgi:Tol biopolymer transport system component